MYLTANCTEATMFNNFVTISIFLTLWPFWLMHLFNALPSTRQACFKPVCQEGCSAIHYDTYKHRYMIVCLLLSVLI